MTDAERMLLSDAISTAISAEKKAKRWKRWFIISFLILICVTGALLFEVTV